MIENTDRAYALARMILVDVMRGSNELTQSFLREHPSEPNEPISPVAEIPLPWPILDPAEISIALVVVANIVRGVGFDAEADRLRLLGEVAGHG